MLQSGRAVIIVYALLMLGGGIGGYAAKKSLPSLISGILSAILLGIGYSMLSSKPKSGYGLCAVVAVLLTAVFIARTIQTMKEPSNMMRNVGLAVLSLIVAAIFAKCASQSSA